MKKYILTLAGAVIFACGNIETGEAKTKGASATKTATESGVATDYTTSNIQKGQKIQRTHDELNEFFESLGEFVYKEGDIKVLSEKDGAMKVLFTEMARSEEGESGSPIEMVIPIRKARFFICNENMEYSGLGDIEVSRDDMPTHSVRIYFHEGEKTILAVRENIPEL